MRSDCNYTVVRDSALSFISAVPAAARNPKWYGEFNNSETYRQIHMQSLRNVIDTSIRVPDLGYYASKRLEEIERLSSEIESHVKGVKKGQLSSQLIESRFKRNLREIESISADLYEYVTTHSPEILKDPND